MRHDSMLTVLALSALATLASGCSAPQNYTTLTLRNGTVLRGDIVSANATHRSILFEQAPDWTVNVMGIPVGPDGDRLVIATDDVREVEHVEPWKLPVFWSVVAVGAVLMTGGGAMMLVSEDDSSSTGPILLATGGVMTVTGLIYAIATHVHVASSEALWSEAASAPPLPGPAPGGQVGVSWRFDGL